MHQGSPPSQVRFWTIFLPTLHVRICPANDPRCCFDNPLTPSPSRNGRWPLPLCPATFALNGSPQPESGPSLASNPLAPDEDALEPYPAARAPDLFVHRWQTHRGSALCTPRYWVRMCSRLNGFRTRHLAFIFCP